MMWETTYLHSKNHMGFVLPWLNATCFYYIVWLQDILQECHFENVPIRHLHIDDLGRSFSSFAVACMKNDNNVAYVMFSEIIGLITSVLTDMLCILTVFFEKLSSFNFKLI